MKPEIRLRLRGRITTIELYVPPASTLNHNLINGEERGKLIECPINSFYNNVLATSYRQHFRFVANIPEMCCTVRKTVPYVLRHFFGVPCLKSAADSVKLAEARVNRAIQDIRLIGNFSNKAAYEFDEDDVKKIFRALQKATEAARQKFGNGDGSRENEFSLED